MSELLRRIQTDTQNAMRARERERVGTLRFISAAILRVEKDQRRELSDAEVLGVLERLARQYRETLEAYQQAGREDLVRKESAELECLQEYLPRPLSEEALTGLIREVLAESGAQSMRDMGRVMRQLQPRLAGRADMRAVGEHVKRLLTPP